MRAINFVKNYVAASPFENLIANSVEETARDRAVDDLEALRVGKEDQFFTEMTEFERLVQVVESMKSELLVSITDVKSEMTISQ